jgi:organic hydroperoxide reductase OsmC/OhrA
MAVILEDFMDIIKPLFTATATATGGRNGHTQASDGSVSADLSVPKATPLRAVRVLLLKLFEMAT